MTAPPSPTDPPRLSADEAAGLVRLRIFLLHALESVRDGTDPGRHNALVGLDGVCEFAAGLVVRRAGLAASTNSFDAALKALPQLAVWRRNGFEGVKTLHHLRNLAQHSGILPDERHMPQLAADAEAFVVSLVEAAFEVDLGEVVLADAIVDKSLRETLKRAEQRLENGDASGAFDAAVLALKEARRSWHGQQEDAYGFLPQRPILDADPDWVDSSWQVDDYADVGVFASDLGEYHWLLATRRQEVVP